MVEATIAIAIIMIVLTGIISVYPLLFRTSLNTIEGARGAMLLEEGIEAVKTMRDNSWNSYIAASALTASTTYFLSFATSTGWSATLTPTLVDSKFSRTFSVYYICRDANYDIVDVSPTTTAPTCSSPQTSDLNTRKVTVSVSWREGNATSTKVISTFITDLFGD